VNHHVSIGTRKIKKRTNKNKKNRIRNTKQKMKREEGRERI
jgi:hypothetical protein